MPGVTAADVRDDDVVGRYLELGLRLGRHVDGFVDAYYGPPELAARVAAGPVRASAELAADAGRLVADLDAGAAAGTGEGAIEAGRRRWIRAQVLGLRTSAQKLAGEPIGYLDEVERCYGVRPARVPDDELAAAHARLAAALPGSGPLRDRYIAWRESHAVPPDTLESAIRVLADDLRERTDRLFGLPDGEHVHWVFETGKPWSGFNYYEGGLRSRVAINVDLPVLSLTLGHLVAHEAYPGHHWHLSWMAGTPHTVRKLVRTSYFNEGWALYSELMMREQGFFTAPEHELAHLHARIFRAARIVVDTALHSGQMSIDEAERFMVEKSSINPDTAVTEVNRYCSWPTQAPSYLTGSLQIEQMRTDYLAADRGDLRSFHDTLAGSGSLPLGLARRAVLEG